MASLILSEYILYSSSKGEPLYLAALDTQRAFDMACHPVLVKLLYRQGINSHFWHVIQSMYSGLTEVGWEGEVRKPVCILQGVRQGGIPSNHFYKTYLNGFLLELEPKKL